MTAQLRPIPAKDLVRALEIYTEAFPEEERRPWDSLLECHSSGTLTLHGIYLGEELAGIMTVWDFGAFRYIEHLAVSPRYRGHGIGSIALGEVTRPVVLEVELPTPTDPMTARRIEFYRRHGLEVLPVSYIQPPYTPDLPEIEMLLMGTPGIVADEIPALLHRHVYRKE